MASHRLKHYLLECVTMSLIRQCVWYRKRICNPSPALWKPPWKIRGEYLFSVPESSFPGALHWRLGRGRRRRRKLLYGRAGLEQRNSVWWRMQTINWSRHSFGFGLIRLVCSHVPLIQGDNDTKIVRLRSQWTWQLLPLSSTQASRLLAEQCWVICGS